jgi:hypothetical protein
MLNGYSSGRAKWPFLEMLGKLISQKKEKLIFILLLISLTLIGVCRLGICTPI